MRRATQSLAVILCGWPLLGVVPAMGQQATKPEGRKVMATCTATTQVKPDAARVTFVITTTEPADKTVREAHEKHVKAVKDALASLALDKVETEIHILPTAFTTLVVPPQNPGAPPTVQSKRAQSVFQVGLRDKDLDKLRKAAGKIAETAMDNGGTAVDADLNPPARPFRIMRRAPGGLGGGPGLPGAIADDPDPIAGPTIEWLATNPAEARREAVRRAVQDAQADAEAASGSTKLTVVEINVRELNEQQSVRYRVRGDPSGADSALIPLRIEVRVTYSY